MGEFRIRRVADEIKRVIGEILIRDLPSNDYGLVTVTKVKCTTDLKIAKVYISILNHDAKQRQMAVNLIKNKVARIRGLVGNRMVLKYTPRIIFYEDETQEYAENMERLFQTLKGHDGEPE